MFSFTMHADFNFCLLRLRIKKRFFDTFNNQIVSRKICMKINYFTLNGQMVVQTFLNCNKILLIIIEVLNFIIIPLCWTQNQFALLCKFVISEFVITIKFCKDLLKFLPGIPKKFAQPKIHYIRVRNKRVLQYCISEVFLHVTK